MHAMLWWYDVMIKYTTSIHKGKHCKAYKSHKTALRVQASMGSRYYPLEVGGLKLVLSEVTGF